MNDKNNHTIIILTKNYPFGAVSESFLDREIQNLCELFKKIVIIPSYLPLDEEKIERIFPANVIIDNSLLEKKRRSILYYITKTFTSYQNIGFVIKEIFGKPINFWKVSYLKLMFSVFFKSLQIKDWALQYIIREKIENNKTLFYTYWMNETTLGIGLVKKTNKGIKLVTRAHRWDLYENEGTPPYLPFQKINLSLIDMIFLISEHGKSHLLKQYPQFKTKYQLSRLGVGASGFLTQKSSDKVLRVVSCSYVIPVKRLDLIINGLKELSISYPELQIHWIHIGYGPLLDKIKIYANRHLSGKVSYKFLGYISESPVISYYCKNPIDVFINLSASEGIPVSIMEAQSCGIPVIATAVGGTPEIVNETVGILLCQNPSSYDIKNALIKFVDNSIDIQKMKMNAFENWEINYNADKNFYQFGLNLKKI